MASGGPITLVYEGMVRDQIDPDKKTQYDIHLNYPSMEIVERRSPVDYPKEIRVFLRIPDTHFLSFQEHDARKYVRSILDCYCAELMPSDLEGFVKFRRTDEDGPLERNNYRYYLSMPITNNSTYIKCFPHSTDQYGPVGPCEVHRSYDDSINIGYVFAVLIIDEWANLDGAVENFIDESILHRKKQTP